MSLPRSLQRTRTRAMVFGLLALGLLPLAGCGSSSAVDDGGRDGGEELRRECAALAPADEGRRCDFEEPCVRDWTGPTRCGLETWRCVDGRVGYEDGTVSCPDAGSDGGSDGGADGGVDGGSDGGADGGVDDAGIEPSTCGGGAPVFAGDLCGVDGAPCRVLEDVTLAGPRFRNGAPHVAVHAGAPAVVYSTAEGGFRGHYSTPRDSVWSSEDLPRPLALGAVVFRADAPTVVAYGGELSTELLERSTSGWRVVSRLDGLTDSAAVAADDGGCLHLARSVDSGSLVHSRFDGRDWVHRTLTSGNVESRAALALGASGAPHAVWYETVEASWRLRWRAGEGAAEEVYALGSSLEDGVLGLAVTGETPHVLHVDAAGRLRYATRTGTGWTSSALAVSTRVGCDPGVEPSEAGQVCAFVRTVPRLLGIGTSGTGAVRILYALAREEGDLVSDCDGPGGGGGPPPPSCRWSGTPRWSGTLHVATPSPAGLTVQQVTGGLTAGLAGWSGHVAVGPSGELHLAVYELSEDGSGYRVRYLRVGPDA